MPAPTIASALLLGILTACAPALGVRADTVQDRLYFGRNHDGREVVTDSAWTRFLAEEVTPRFPEGFSVFSGNGQWRGGNGTIEREESFLLEVTHPATRRSDSLVVALIAIYKARFEQDAVLRVTIPVRARF